MKADRPILHEPYPEPVHGTREEAITRALAAHKAIDRATLNTKQTTPGGGMALTDRITWLLDVWVRAGNLPKTLADVVRLYYLEDGPNGLRRNDADVGIELGLSRHQVKRLRYQAIRTLAGLVFESEEGGN